MSWSEELSQIDDAYLIWDIDTMDMVGLIEADKDGRHDMQIATKMNQLGYVIMRLNFDDLIRDGVKFKNELQIRQATQELMRGF